jgi:4-hydroxybenzoate polyprenyltransferase
VSTTTLPGLLRACHPGPCLAVTAFTSALALAAGRGAGSAWVALAVLSGHLSVGWSNDWIDADRDRAAGRRDKPVVTGAASAAAVGSAALVALVACVPLSVIAGGIRAAAVHLLAVGVAWAYNLGLKGTVSSPLPYAVSFALLPVFVAASVGGTAPWWTVVATALLGAGAHFTNALPDLDADDATGVRGLPQRIGRRASVLAGAALLLAGAGIVAAALPPGVAGRAAAAVAGVLLATGAALGLGRRHDARRAPFTLTMLGAGALVVALVAAGATLA